MNKDSDAKQMYYAQKGFGPTTHDSGDDDSGDENEKEEGEISEDEPKPKWDNNIVARTFIKKFIDEVKKTSTGNRKEVDEYDNAISYFYHEGEDYLKQDEEIAKRFEFLMENAEEMYPNGRATGPWMALCQEAVEFLAEERDSFALLTIAEKYADDDNDDEDDEEGEDMKNADDEMSENEEIVDDDDDHKTETLSDDEQILTPTTDASETATSLTVEQVERIRACQILDKKHAEVKRNTTYT
ncbi:hypothetical protein B0J14DRAFT_569554 [Halenospora varia]|nr:hypothetical protein B0J14DRAFT_569554 [Halenospora varia]